MAYDETRPTDTEYIADGPGVIRENQRALKDDKIVNAGKLQDKVPGNASGNIPLNNGVLNVGLNSEKVGGKLVSELAPAQHGHSVATTSSDGFMSNSDKVKLNGIAAGAEVNQNAFAKVLVGTTEIIADSKQDVLEMSAGTNIELTPDAANDRVTIGFKGPIPAASVTENSTKRFADERNPMAYRMF